VFSYYIRWQRGTARIRLPRAALLCAVQQSIAQRSFLLWHMLGRRDRQMDGRTDGRLTDA